MNNVVIQNASTSTQTPSEQDLQTWIDSALHDYAHDTEIVVRIVDEPESAALNVCASSPSRASKLVLVLS